MTLESENSTSELIKDPELGPVAPEISRLDKDQKGAFSTVQNKIAEETLVSLLFPIRLGIFSKMTFVAVSTIGYDFGCQSRETLSRARKIPVVLPSQRVMTVELSTTCHYLLIDSVIDLMSVGHLLYD